jgi:cation:H+ antiporter
MFLAYLQLLGGALMLYAGADWLVAGAVGLALALRLPQLIIGLTVVAYGTSAPEAIVGVQAAATGHGEVVLGNIVGSNIANIGLILGLTALIRPVTVEGSLGFRELPVLALSTALLPLLLADGRVARWEGVGLLLLAAAYTAWTVHGARRRPDDAPVGSRAVSGLPPATTADRPAPRRSLRLALLTLGGLGVLLLGGHWFVEGAIDVARRFGMSERLLGLTVVAIGTSLPELVTSLVAASRGHADLAVGNLLGSNIFNVLFCLGSAAVVGRVAVSPAVIGKDLVALVLMTLLCTWLTRRARRLSRADGALAFLAYMLLMALELRRG